MAVSMIILRPHHLLCIKGYKGYNYNAAQVGVWDRVTKFLKDNPDTDIFIGQGKDSLCSTCPAGLNSNNGIKICIEKNIRDLDVKVRQFLGLSIGEKKKFSELMDILNKKFTREKHEELCSKCFWWQKGLCRDSFKSVTEK